MSMAKFSTAAATIARGASRSEHHVDAKRVKYRKQAARTHARQGVSRRLGEFGEYGLQALEPRGSEPGRSRRARRITRSIKRGGKMWIASFPDSR